MSSKIIHSYDVCEYCPRVTFNNYHDRGMFECLICHNWYCDECHKEHAIEECFE